MIPVKHNQDGSSIFIWGHFGEKLKEMDNERYLALGQSNPHLFLAKIYNRNIRKAIKLLTKDKKSEEYIKAIEHENYLDNLFRRYSEFLRLLGDSVTVGSALTGETQTPPTQAKIVFKKDGGQNE